MNNHLRELVSIDFFTVSTATFRVLFVFIVLAHDRRRVLHFNVTEHPTPLSGLRNRSWKLSLTVQHLGSSSEIETRSMAQISENG